MGCHGNSPIQRPVWIPTGAETGGIDLSRNKQDPPILQAADTPGRGAQQAVATQACYDLWTVQIQVVEMAWLQGECVGPAGIGSRIKANRGGIVEKDRLL